MSEVIRLPARRPAAVWLLREGSAWLVLAGAHGWLVGDHCSALSEAKWLSKNFGLPIRHPAEEQAT